MSKRTSIRIPDDLYQEIVKRANQERRTVSNLIIALLSEALFGSVNVASNVADGGAEGDQAAS